MADCCEYRNEPWGSIKCDGAVVKVTVLEAGMSRVRFPFVSLKFSL